MAHGYNLGAVIAKPQNGSGLHSHTTAEVFLIYSGSWRYYWGAEGKEEIMLNARKKSTVKRVARALKKASRSHAGQAKKLEKVVNSATKKKKKK